MTTGWRGRPGWGCSVRWLLVALAVVPGTLRGQASRAKGFEFRGHRLGDQNWGLSCLPIEGLTTDQLCGERTKIGDAWATVTYKFYDGKLGSIMLAFEPSDFQEVVLAFQEKFGAPRLVSAIVSNAMGAKLRNVTAWWTTSAGPLMVEKYGTSLDVGDGFVSASWADRLEAQRKAAVRKRNGI